MRQLIKKIQLRTRHCMHRNAAFSTEIRRKVSYAGREGSRYHLVLFCSNLSFELTLHSVKIADLPPL